jgi:hypothetical protein
MQSHSQPRSRRREVLGGVTRTVLRWEFGASTQKPLRLNRTSTATHLFTASLNRSQSRLATLARVQRQQLEALVATGVTASLQRSVEGWTRLASLWPAREPFSGSVLRPGARRVFTLHPPRPPWERS